MEKEIAKVVGFLNRHKLKHLLIGGCAVVFYGVPRSTFDIDIGILADKKEISKAMKWLSELGFHLKENLDGGVKMTDGNIGVDLMFISSPAFGFYYEYRNERPFMGTTLKLPSILDLIRMKENSSRAIDQEDAKNLRFIMRTRGK